MPDYTDDDDFVYEDIWDDMYDGDFPDTASDADDCADIMLDFLDASDEDSFPDAVASAAATVIVGAPKTDEFTIADLPLETPKVGARPLVK